jgi:hypothetical protein
VPQLRVHRDEDSGEPKVECPSCGENVSPARNPLLDSYDCECGGVMELGSMRAYERALAAWERELEDGGMPDE